MDIELDDLILLKYRLFLAKLDLVNLAHKLKISFIIQDNMKNKAKQNFTQRIMLIDHKLDIVPDDDLILLKYGLRMQLAGCVSLLVVMQPSFDTLYY